MMLRGEFYPLCINNTGINMVLNDELFLEQHNDTEKENNGLVQEPMRLLNKPNYTKRSIGQT
jgi:hypothetical protein